MIEIVESKTTNMKLLMRSPLGQQKVV